ncbi:MAG: hypothetical protein ABH885_01530 [Candidatus Omnitrophota bacterium]
MIKRYLPVLFIMLAYYAAVFLCTADFPINDDYDILKSVTDYGMAASPSEKIKILYAWHNEHRIAFIRLIFIAQSRIANTVGFREVALIGNLAVLGIFSIFAGYISRNKPCDGKCLHISVFIIACLLFQYGFAGASLWAMGSISAFFGVLFCLVAILCFCGTGRGVFLAGICASVLAVSVSGQGIIVYPIGLTRLFFRKKRIEFLILLFIFIAVICLYFQGYKSDVLHSNPFDLAGVFRNMPRILIYIPAFLGSAFGIGNPAYPVVTAIFLSVTALIGVLVIVFWMYLTYKRYYMSDEYLYWFGVYIIISALAAALTRIPYGLWQALSSRYHVSSVVILISGGLLVLKMAKDKCFDISAAAFKKGAILSAVYLALTVPVFLYYFLVYYAPARKGEIIYPDKARAEGILGEARLSGLMR